MYNQSINQSGSPKQNELTVISSKTTKLKAMMWHGEWSIKQHIMLSHHHKHGTIMSTHMKTGEPTKPEIKIIAACKPK